MFVRNSISTCLLVVTILTFAVGIIGCGGQEEAARYEELDEKLEAAAAESDPEDPTVFFQNGREWYHKQGCQRLRRGSAEVIDALRSEAESLGLAPCIVCRPGE